MRKNKFVYFLLVFAAVFLFVHTGLFAFAERGDKDKIVELPIVMYHKTCKEITGKYSITPEQFEKDILYLKNRGYAFVVVGDLLKYQQWGTPLPKKAVMISLDDGYVNNYLNIFPLLKKHNVKCVISVIGNLTDANYKKGYEVSSIYSYVTYEQIKEMKKSGLVEIQNHTYSMHDYGKGSKRFGLQKRKDETLPDYQKALSENLLKLNGKLFLNSGVICTALTYPLGAYNDEAIAVAKSLGFKAGLTCNEHVNKITKTSSLFKLGRFNRPFGPTAPEFFKKLGIH
jgi:peptidoglycan/xylan/chitin deacetylase (PgdA/CDA1 family)